MLLARGVAFLVVLVLVLGAAIALQNQALLVPRLAWLGGPGGAAARTAADDCLYLGLKGLQAAPRRGPSCSLLMDGAWQNEAFWNRAEASVRARARSGADPEGD